MSDMPSDAARRDKQPEAGSRRSLLPTRGAVMFGNDGATCRNLGKGRRRHLTRSGRKSLDLSSLIDAGLTESADLGDSTVYYRYHRNHTRRLDTWFEKTKRSHRGNAIVYGLCGGSLISVDLQYETVGLKKAGLPIMAIETVRIGASDERMPTCTVTASRGHGCDCTSGYQEGCPS